MYIADSARYEKMEYRKSGHSGLKLPILSLGLWQNFGDYDPIHNQRDFKRRIRHGNYPFRPCE